jgi:ribose-phosphate pyrophosphokinase
MEIRIFSGSANLPLAMAVCQTLGVKLGERTLERFPDSELHVELKENVRERDVYLIQPTSPPVDQNLLEIIFLADACRRASAGRLTAVLPYFGYARQDRRARGREPVGVRVIADLLKTGGVQRVIAVDRHSPATEAAFSIPLEHLSAIPLLAEALRPFINRDTVIVSPDLGAVKLAERYATSFGLPVVILHKRRLSGEEVAVQSIVGDVKGRRVVIVDDMISTAGTIEGAAKTLLAAGSASQMIVVATHTLLAGPAVRRLLALSIDRLLTTDSVTMVRDIALPVQVVSLAPLIADVIARLHENKSLGDLIWHE